MYNLPGAKLFHGYNIMNIYKHKNNFYTNKNFHSIRSEFLNYFCTGRIPEIPLNIDPNNDHETDPFNNLEREVIINRGKVQK